MQQNRILSAVILSATFASLASAQVVTDDFDTNTSANYAVVSTSDALATFAFNYGAMGIPPAPNTPNGTTLGLKLEANVTSIASHAVTLHTLQQYTGDRVIKFDAWINANGPFPGGGAGSTEFLTCGVGGDGLTPNRGGATGSGAWFAVSGEGGSTRDWRGYKLVGEQFAESGQFHAGTSSAGGGAHNSTDPYYAAFGSVDVGNLPVQGANNGGPLQQTGITQAGSFGFAWHQVVITVDVDGGTGGAPSVRWSVDGLRIATLDAGIGATFSSNGSVTIGYMDIFTSLSDNPALSFGLIDNLRIGTAGAASSYGTNPAHPTFGLAQLVGATAPAIGANGTFDLTYAASGPEVGVLVLGVAPLSLPFLNATVLVAPPFVNIPFATTPPSTNFSLGVPNNQSLVGGQLYFQGVILDTVLPQTPFGLMFTDGLNWTIGF